jgi:isopropylmalate/homocitrate/citramalate synthase
MVNDFLFWKEALSRPSYPVGMKEQIVKLIECPRDAWQGLPKQIPTERKVQYLRALIEAGFTHLDAVSFVSPKAVPQMADSEIVLAQLTPPNDVEIIGIAVNEKGERAIAMSGHDTRFPCRFRNVSASKSKSVAGRKSRNSD